MKILLFAVISLLLGIPLIAQNPSFSSPELFFQTRVLQQATSYEESYFQTQADIGLGIRWNLTLNPALDVSLGTMLNYGAFEKANRDNSDIYYIDFFKSQAFHYYNVESISQWTVEIPVSLRWSAIDLGSHKIGFFAGGSPQFFLANKATGTGFDGNEDRFITLNSANFPLDDLFIRDRIITDIYLQSGAYFTREVLDGRSLLFEIGYEYSTKGKSNGVLMRLGYGF